MKGELVPMDQEDLDREAKHRAQSAERIVAEFVRTVAPNLHVRDQYATQATLFQIEQTHARLRRLVPDDEALADLIRRTEVGL